MTSLPRNAKKFQEFDITFRKCWNSGKNSSNDLLSTLVSPDTKSNFQQKFFFFDLFQEYDIISKNFRNSKNLTSLSRIVEIFRTFQLLKLICAKLKNFFLQFNILTFYVLTFLSTIHPKKHFFNILCKTTY